MIEDAIHDLIDAEDIQTAWKIHQTLMASFGFDRIIYGMTHFRLGDNVGTPEDLLILTNHSKEYVDFLLRDGNYLRGPMGKWAMNNTGAQSWSLMAERIQSGHLEPDELAVVQFNQKMGVTAGYTVSFSGSSERYAAAISLVAQIGMTQEDVDMVWAKNERSLVSANKIFNLKCTTLPHETSAPLTRRQKEVLDWAGDGKSIADIGVVLGLTPATVEKHLRLARLALKAETTAQAVLKHAYQNQVFVSN